MGWQFTINDYTTGTLVSKAIDEPVGWDAVNLHLKRDDKAHGFFSFENDVFSSLQFDGAGSSILRNAYYTYGTQAKVLLGVTYACDQEETPDNLYLGTFDFTTFKDYTADRCYVECATFVSEAYMLFNNRRGQSVDLDSLVSYDQLPVTQTVHCNAIFQSSPNQIRVTQLMNGLMPGSKLTIFGSTANDGIYTIASSKPDYSTVNADLAGGGTSVSTLTVSATFDANTMVISINQLVNVAVGTTLSLSTTTWPSGNVTYTVYDNSGTYNILSVQQFFNYTRLHVSLASLVPTTPSITLNYQGTPQMVSTSQDAVLLTGGIIYTSQPTATIITVAEAITTEALIDVNLTAEWLKNNMLPYNGLSKIITVPSKVIEATSTWKQIIDTEYVLNNSMGHAYPGDGGSTYIIPNWTNIQSDIDETDVADMPPDYEPNTNAPFSPFAFFRQSSLACIGLASVDLKFSGQFIGNSGFSPSTDIFDLLPPGGSIGPAQSSQFRVRVQQATQWNAGLAQNEPAAGTIIDTVVTVNSDGTFAYDSGVISNISFTPGNYLWIYFAIWAPLRIDHQVQMLINAESYCKFTINSQSTDTPCSVYLINEALSRCVESYTNGDIQVYSDYFGRQTAQPVASSVDGCGGIACITNGLRIRGCVMPDQSSIPKFFISLDDMLTALDAIHNIGWALEPDPNRTGYMRLRVEPFEHWFQNTVLLTCQNIMGYTRETVTSLLASTFKCGYQQFETWNNNGLYDIFGSRTYRTPLNHLVNEIDKTCKWIASDYAIEFTRRQFGVTTSDSRYDSSTFILQLINKYQGPVEQAQTCFLISTTGTIFTAGNSIIISGSLYNNGTYTISSMPVPSFAGNNLAYVFVSGHTFTNEQAPAITVVQGANTYANVPCYFIGANGAIVLDDLDLFGAAPNDTIVITSTYGGTYTIGSIYAPVTASQPGNLTPFDFPMIIFPTTALSYYFPVAYDPAAIINDTTNQFYAVEQGMQHGTNILSPETVMNYRISPAHAAMRHYRNIITDRQYATESLIFTGGEGNFYALGQIADSCSPENDNISEGGNLSLSNFTVPDDGKPLFYPEIVKFEYPLSWNQFLAIQANPYGLIQYEHTNEGLQSGWLTDLQYHPYTGMAEFTLYPKI